MKYYTLKQASEILNYTPDSIRVRINEKKINATKLGRDWFIDKIEMNKLIKKHKRPSE